MHNILKTLSESQTVVDLGCGGGSFNYASYQCRIIGIDILINAQGLCRDGNRLQYIQSSANEIPLACGAVDAVICHHSLEHFSNHVRTLEEINRILKPNGLLWIAVPNGYSFDDALYRFTDAGHSHVNRFTLKRLIEDVQKVTDLKLVQWISLFSGFVYLKKPLPGIPSLFGRFMKYLPDDLNTLIVLGFNTVTRFIDKIAGSRLSQYGWAFVFARQRVVLDSLPSYFNVCWKCGSGHGADFLRSTGRVRSLFGLSLFTCPQCQGRSIFFEPPDGLS